MITTKKCTYCQIEKDLDSFHRSKTKRCGRLSKCKQCHSEEYRSLNFRKHIVHSSKRIGAV